VTDRRVSRLPLAEAVAEAVAGGVDWVQLRERDLEGAALLELAEEIAVAARLGARARPGGGAVQLIVNRRLDVALALGDAGVHLGFDAMAPAEARRLLGPTRLIGISAHAVAEVAAAATAGTSYACLAPIFLPRSKPATRPALGVGVLTDAARYGIPVLAQGGAQAANAAELVAAGAAGVAVTGAILLADDPGAAATQLRHALDLGGPAVA
jgi:thiamine-phosphate pyrophosphorylase